MTQTILPDMPAVEPQPSPCGEVHVGETCNAYFCDARLWSYDTNRITRGHWVHPGEYDNETGCERCEYCPDHCECSHCENCGPVESTCPTCELCSDSCCDCSYCSTCDSYISSNGNFCGDCDRCASDCRCEPELNLDEDDQGENYPHAGNIMFHKPGAHQLTRNASKRFAALEIEIASTANGNAPSLNTTLVRWRAALVHDGSISGGNYEREINTAPAAGDLLVDQISEIADALASDGGTANKSCGIHCHVDCRDFSFYDMRRLILLYEKIEDALFDMVPRSRRTSQWCHPCGKRYGDAIRDGRMPTDDNAKKAIVNNLYGVGDDMYDIDRAIKRAKQDKYNSVRYSALNLHSWIYRGTVECRIHHGTVGKKNLTNWALLWVGIVDYAHAHTEAEVTGLTGSPLDVLKQIAPALSDWIDTRVSRFSDGRDTEDVTPVSMTQAAQPAPSAIPQFDRLGRPLTPVRLRAGCSTDCGASCMSIG